MTLNDLCDLENEVKVVRFHLILHLALVPLGAKFSEFASNISSDIKRKPFLINLNDLGDLEHKVKVTRFFLGLCPILVPLCTKFSESLPNSSSGIERKPFQTRPPVICR